jgi:hypothetical protein
VVVLAEALEVRQHPVKDLLVRLVLVAMIQVAVVELALLEVELTVAMVLLHL